jgi:hypothetical protein
MKTTGLLFLAMNWAVLMPGTSFAVPSNPASPQTSPASSANTTSGPPRDAGHAAPPRDGRRVTGGKVSDERRGHGRISNPHHPPGSANLTRANRPKQLPHRPQHSIPGNGLNVYPPGSDKPRGAAQAGLVANGTLHSALLVRTPSVFLPTGLPPNNVRHHRPNPTVVGGSPNLHSNNTGAINGTRMIRKP